jgi:hypothetical protein
MSSTSGEVILSATSSKRVQSLAKTLFINEWPGKRLAQIAAAATIA